jgi:hypothetical protein
VFAPAALALCGAAVTQCTSTPCDPASLAFDIKIDGVTAFTIRDNQAAVSCALAAISGIASFSFTFPTITPAMLQSGAVVSVNADYFAQPNGYSSAAEAQTDVMLKIANGMDAFVKLLALNPAFSSIGSASIVKDSGIANPVPTSEPTGFDAAALGASSGSSTGGSSLNVALVVGLACALAVVCAVGGLWYYCYYRRNLQNSKIDNVKNRINFTETTGVVPREEDAVEWGLGVNSGMDDMSGVMAPPDNLDSSPALKTRHTPTKQRKSDLFVI